MRARQAERPWFRSWWMTEKAAVAGGGLPCQHQRQLFHFASLCFASLHFYSRFHCRRNEVLPQQTTLLAGSNWQHSHQYLLCGFTFSENIQFSQKLLTVLLVTQSHPLDLSQSDVLVYQEEPCRGQILSLASKLKAPQSRLSHDEDRRAAASDLGLCLCALRRSRPDWCAGAHKPCSATRSSHRVF